MLKKLDMYDCAMKRNFSNKINASCGGEMKMEKIGFGGIT